MKSQSSFKKYVVVFLQIFAAMIAFIFSLIMSRTVMPFSAEFVEASPASGFLSLPVAMLVNGLVNALVLVWAGRRLSFKGLRLTGALLVLSFGIQVFMTQIETGYFLSAFPLLQNSFDLYMLVLRGLFTSSLFSLLVTWIVGGFSNAPRPAASMTLPLERVVRQGAWLAVVYIALYMLFGYFVAWQSQELRLFYNGPAQLNGFFEQWGISLMQTPEMPVFQYFRGVLWVLCLIPLFLGFNGKRGELVLLSALAMGLLPTAQLAFPNPLMPAGVSLYHFWEVSLSTGIFGALCAWMIPHPKPVTRSALDL